MNTLNTTLKCFFLTRANRLVLVVCFMAVCLLGLPAYGHDKCGTTAYYGQLMRTNPAFKHRNEQLEQTIDEEEIFKSQAS